MSRISGVIVVTGNEAKPGFYPNSSRTAADATGGIVNQAVRRGRLQVCRMNSGTPVVSARRAISRWTRSRLESRTVGSSKRVRRTVS